MLKIKRVYEEPQKSDGYRILIDRLWPRGVSKEKAAVNIWLKDVAPSSELRTWFGHDPKRFAEFATRYRAELKGNPAVKELRHLLKEHVSATLLYGARDQAHNHAQVLLKFLQK